MLQGRLENEMKITKSIEQKLKFCPLFVKKWQNYLYVSQVTAASRMDMLNKICRFLKTINNDIKQIKPKDISEDDVFQYCISIRTKVDKNEEVVETSDSYQQSVYSALNNLFNYLESKNQIRRNYLRGINRPKNRDLDRINANRELLTEEDFKNILEAIDSTASESIRVRNIAIMRLLMSTGMRKTALISINISDLDFASNKLMVIDKGDKVHIYPLNKNTVDAIKNWLKYRDRYIYRENTDALFLSQEGHRISVGAITKLVKKYTEIALGKPLSPHKIRSGYCSILYEHNPSIEFVQKAVGHSNLSTTQRYIVTKGEEKDLAAEIMGGII